MAKSVELGLKETGIQTLCINARDATVGSLKEFDLIAIRAPTQGFTASKQMKESLQKLKNINLSEKYGFAFDIKIDYRLSGSAAKFIEKELVNIVSLMITGLLIGLMWLVWFHPSGELRKPLKDAPDQ